MRDVPAYAFVLPAYSSDHHIAEKCQITFVSGGPRCWVGRLYGLDDILGCGSVPEGTSLCLCGEHWRALQGIPAAHNSGH